MQSPFLPSTRLTPTHPQIRPLASTDNTRGHISVLSVLTTAPDPTPSAYLSQFTLLRSSPTTYHTLVIVHKPTDQIVAVGTLFIERKFLRALGSVGHIEDIAVRADQQGRKLGLRIIQALVWISESSGCYKTILNCNDDNIREYPSSPPMLPCLYQLVPTQHSTKNADS